MEQKKLSVIDTYKQEINTQLANTETMNFLVKTTFKGLDEKKMKSAILEGCLRGFEFKNFLEGDVYALPFGVGYSLVTSIRHARKVAMRSGLVGKNEPSYEVENGKIISCTVTVKRKVDEYVGDFTATVFFDEYYKSNGGMWDKMPRTMIAKVAEMHALRSAFPEETSQMYIEEEAQVIDVSKDEYVVNINDEEIEKTLLEIKEIKTLEELKDFWVRLSPELKSNEAIQGEKEKQKNTLSKPVGAKTK